DAIQLRGLQGILDQHHRTEYLCVVRHLNLLRHTNSRGHSTFSVLLCHDEERVTTCDSGSSTSTKPTDNRKSVGCDRRNKEHLSRTHVPHKVSSQKVRSGTCGNNNSRVTSCLA